MIKKIISGGQTGVDQASLDAAIACNIEYGGWLPTGRMTENGPLSPEYKMNVLSGGYKARTRKNVTDSDATLIISHGPLTGGSALTAKIAKSTDKPYLHIDLKKSSLEKGMSRVAEWIHNNNPTVLNIAGPRASSGNSIYASAYEFVCLLLGES